MRMSVREQIATAVTEHAKWIVNLSECLEGLADNSPRQCQKYLARVGAEDACSLGRWLQETKDDDASEHLRAVRDIHRRFHKAASEVIALALAGDADAATGLLEGELCTLSRQLVAALDAWERSESGG